MRASKLLVPYLVQAFSHHRGGVPLIRGIAGSAALTFLCIVSAPAKTHVIKVWGGYYQFIPRDGLTVQLGDTLQWLPLDNPFESHDIASTNIPANAKPFQTAWKAPDNLFFQYVPKAAGLYEYHCIPHHQNHNMKGSFTVQGAATIPGNAPFPSVLLEHLNPSRRELNFSEPYIGYPFALYDHIGKKLFSGITGRSVDISNLAAGSYHLEVNAGKTHTQKLVIK